MKKTLIIIGIVILVVLGAIGIKMLIDNNSTEEISTSNINNMNSKTEKENKNVTLAGQNKGYSSTNPVIPQGFKTIDTEKAKWAYTDNNKTVVQGWNEGLVIEDQKGNQFVWVPCSLDSEKEINGTKIAKYEKCCARSSGFVDSTKETTVDGVTYKARPVENEDAQIAKYGGFYIARYEAGLDKLITEASTNINNVYTKIPVSKRGAQVWNYIDYTHSYVAADKMINDKSKYGNTKSGLVTGKQWDTIIKWYANSGIIKLDEDGHIVSQDWGTYKDKSYSVSGYFFYGPEEFSTSSTSSTIKWVLGEGEHKANADDHGLFHASGLNKNSIFKNIADMGGNVAEYCSDYSDKGSLAPIPKRGGSARYKTGRSNGSYNDVTCCTGWPDYAGFNDDIGFRVVLYLN